jgi:hypothetical protein
MMRMRKYDHWDSERYHGKMDLRTLGGRETVVVSTPYPSSVGAFTTPAEPEWLADAKQKIEEYTSLSRGWDGYRGIAVDKTTLNVEVCFSHEDAGDIDLTLADDVGELKVYLEEMAR